VGLLLTMGLFLTMWLLCDHQADYTTGVWWGGGGEIPSYIILSMYVTCYYTE
jgi:hypothetical protein